MKYSKFRLLTRAEYAALNGEEKSAYLKRLTRQISEQVKAFRRDQNRTKDWLRRKDDAADAAKRKR